LARRSALRVLEALLAAKDSGSHHGWYAQLDRRDVQALALAQVNATERAVYLKRMAA
jgi:hypothetical protein